MSPAQRREAVEQVREKLGPALVPERRACLVLNQVRSTQRRERPPPSDELFLVRRMVELAPEYGRYGYRRITAMLNSGGWQVNHKRLERLWRRGAEGAGEAAREGATLAHRRLLCEAAACLQGTCLELRLHGGEDKGREGFTHHN